MIDQGTESQEAARQGVGEAKKGLLLRHVYSKRKAEKQLLAWLKRTKGSLLDEKALRIKKKELLTLTLGDDADGRNEGDDDDDGWEPVKLGEQKVKC